MSHATTSAESVKSYHVSEYLKSPKNFARNIEKIRMAGHQVVILSSDGCEAFRTIPGAGSSYPWVNVTDKIRFMSFVQAIEARDGRKLEYIAIPAEVRAMRWADDPSSDVYSRNPDESWRNTNPEATGFSMGLTQTDAQGFFGRGEMVACGLPQPPHTPEETKPEAPGFSLTTPSVNRKPPFGADVPAVRLTEKYRPSTLADVVGQGNVVFQLQSFVEAPYPTPFLFSGETGLGKTTCALALANDLAMNEDWDVEKIGAAECVDSTLDSALRRLRQRGLNGWRMLIIDEADTMSVKCRLMLLSALEDLPNGAIVVMTTNHPEKLERRFVDRCNVLEFASDCSMLLQDAQTLVNRVWLGETGSTDAPDVAALPNICRAGVMSFRRVVNAVADSLRQRAIAPKPEPIEAPVVAVEPEPVKVPARSADSIIRDAVETHREDGLLASMETWVNLTKDEKAGVNRRLVALGCGKLIKGCNAEDRFIDFLRDCTYGKPVAFPVPPIPEPELSALEAVAQVTLAEPTDDEMVKSTVIYLSTPDDDGPEGSPDFPASSPRTPSEVFPAISTHSEFSGRDLTPGPTAEFFAPLVASWTAAVRLHGEPSWSDWMNLPLASKVAFLGLIDALAGSRLVAVAGCDPKDVEAVGFSAWLGFVELCATGNPVEFPLPDPSPIFPEERSEWASNITSTTTGPNSISTWGRDRDPIPEEPTASRPRPLGSSTSSTRAPSAITSCSETPETCPTSPTRHGSSSPSARPTCPETLTIGSTVYGLTRLADGFDLCKGDDCRRVSILPEGPSCDCPSARFRPGPCKHVKALADRNLIPAVVATDPPTWAAAPCVDFPRKGAFGFSEAEPLEALALA